MKHLKLALIALMIPLFVSYSFGQAQSNKVTTPQNLPYQLKIYDSKTGVYKTKAERISEDIVARSNFEYNRLKNPYTGTVPKNIRELEVKFSNKIKYGDDSKKSLSRNIRKKGVQYSYWKNRGPFNVGGRTRALAIDYTNEKVILAGGVSGGLWRSENGGETWRKVTRPFQNPSITAIIQDPRPSHSYIWYYTTGEINGTSTSRSLGSIFTGGGVYKSQDGGRTWELLRATANGVVGSLDSSFNLISSIAINSINGDIYVGTFRGVQRSRDGGNSFEEVLSTRRAVCEVAMTSGGQIYATISTDQLYSPQSIGNPDGGFFTSTDGDTWVNITPTDITNDNIFRTIMATDPSNNNIVYFLSAFNRSPSGRRVSLFKYNAVANTLAESWTDLSNNLPSFLNFQGGYNMVVSVSPMNSNLMFVGGTELYRSNSGFNTPTNDDDLIAGFDTGNQHPDHHVLVFFPSNFSKVLSATDGGVYITEDITTNNLGDEPVKWRSLNNGYITTQPYHVSFDPEPNSDDLVAGFQDNGTWFTNSTASNASWTEDFTADGAYSAIADNGRTRYVSLQGAVIQRLNIDEQGNEVSRTGISPSGSFLFNFINPFVLDPNNDNIMYLPTRKTILRNDNLDGIPIAPGSETTGVNWVQLFNSEIPPNNNPIPALETLITALDVSKYPVANRLYYGTNEGDIFRMDNANIGDPKPSDISTGKGLPFGYVSDINVDPSDSDHVIVSFSNYGIPSIFVTYNGGDSWTDVSGNLEENSDGTGNGPSVRSTAFLGAFTGPSSRSQKVFAATSTGLYYTNYFDGRNTVWRKENEVIGNAVIQEVATRKDGFIAAAAHGNGLFSAHFPIQNPLPESTLTSTFLLENFNADINSEATEIDITGLFVQSAGLPVEIEIMNSNPQLVNATLNGNTLILSYAPDSEGKAVIGLIARSAGEQVSEGFTITVSEPSIYEQTKISNPDRFLSMFIEDIDVLEQLADDITIPEGSIWKINRIFAFGSFTSQDPSLLLDNGTLVIYNDNQGVPGEEIYNSGVIASTLDPRNNNNLNLELSEELVLKSGKYWLSVYYNTPSFGPPFKLWTWDVQEGNIGSSAHSRRSNPFFGNPAFDWRDKTNRDAKFQLFGTIERSKKSLVALKSANLLAWPNPSSDRFTFNFSKLDLGNTIAVAIYDITGKQVHAVSDLKSNVNYVWNATKIPTGFYVVKVKGKSSNMSFKVIKK